MTALVTPFRGGRLDEPRLSALCELQVRAGTAALFVCGSTGESSTLAPAEQARVLAVASEAVFGRIPVFVGCGASATEPAVSLAAGAARGRAAGLLCAPSPYSRPIQEGIAAHVRAVALAAIPVKAVLDLAGRCKTELRLRLTVASASTIGRLAVLIPALLKAEAAIAGPAGLELGDMR